MKWIDRLRLGKSPSSRGWTNDLAYPRAHIYFTDGSDNIKKSLKEKYKIPNAHSILNDRSCLYLIDGGDQKYYLWNDTSGNVAKIDEYDRQEFLKDIGGHDLTGLKYKILIK